MIEDSNQIFIMLTQHCIKASFSISTVYNYCPRNKKKITS